jgi:hypothetical protein
MADFLTAFNATMKQSEYGFNSGSGEALTINGIDRGQNRDWTGWAIVDEIIAANPGLTDIEYNKLFDANADLQGLIQSFFEANYWPTCRCANIINQEVANALYDGTVNPCIIGVGKAAQIAINSLTPGKLTADGQFGPKSLGAVNAEDPQLFVTAFNAVRIADYYQRVSLTPGDGQWLESWLSRCKPYV